MDQWPWALLCGIAGGLLALVIDRALLPPPTLVQLDLAALVNEHIQQSELMQLSETGRSREAARFAARLEQETARFAQEYRAVILAAPAVVSGAPDLTPVLRKRIEAPTP